jgi:hypothetical protein
MDIGATFTMFLRNRLKILNNWDECGAVLPHSLSLVIDAHQTIVEAVDARQCGGAGGPPLSW